MNKVTDAFSATVPPPVREQPNVPGGVGGVDPQVITKLPPPLSTREHESGKVRFLLWAGDTASGAIHTKTTAALPIKAVARAMNDRIIGSPCVGKGCDLSGRKICAKSMKIESIVHHPLAAWQCICHAPIER
jgi:hypothetical protein